MMLQINSDTSAWTSHTHLDTLIHKIFSLPLYYINWMILFITHYMEADLQKKIKVARKYIQVQHNRPSLIHENTFPKYIELILKLDRLAIFVFFCNTLATAV